MDKTINELSATEIEKLQQDLEVHKQELQKLKTQLGEGVAPTHETLNEIFKEEAIVEKDEMAIENISETIAQDPDDIIPDDEQLKSDQVVEEKRSAWQPKTTATALYADEIIAPYVQDCLNIMAEKGVFEAVAHASKLSKTLNIAIVDAFHDFIIDKWRELEEGNYIPRVDL